MPTSVSNSVPLSDAISLAVAADRAIEAGRFREAVDLYLQALTLHPAQPEWHYKLGVAAHNSGLRDLAGQHFTEATILAPHHPAPHQALGDWCRNGGDISGALQHTERAVAIAPNEPEVLVSRAWALAAAGRTAEAWALVEQLNATGYCPPKLAGLCGQIAASVNKEQSALNVLTNVSACSTLSPSDRRQVHFAAAKIFDRLGRYDEAFTHATAAHESNRRPYNPALMRNLVDRRIQYYTPRKLHDLPRASHGSRRPIFILGMPRAGTTLVEQILASHPQVYGAGELPLISELALSMAASDPGSSFDFPECLDSLPLRGANQQAEKFLTHIASLNSTARFVIDKMPENFLFMGFIATMFPDCHVIHCVRDPLDTCLSCYMTDFTHGHEFAQDLDHLGDYYVQYRRLMAHWHDVLHYPMIEVRYEDVVFDLEAQARRLLEQLDLPWDPHCLEFHKNPRYVTTASLHQVRRPIYSESVGRWQHYEMHLSKLKASLQLDTTQVPTLTFPSHAAHSRGNEEPIASERSI
ncbi:MAG TPA: sulfotransferase [Tepidisphaeraceae bacterium]